MQLRAAITGPTSPEASPGTTTWPPTTGTPTTANTRPTRSRPRLRAHSATSRTTPGRSRSTAPSSSGPCAITTSRSTPRSTGCTRPSTSASATWKSPSPSTSRKLTTTRTRRPCDAREAPTNGSPAPPRRAPAHRAPPTTRLPDPMATGTASRKSVKEKVDTTSTRISPSITRARQASPTRRPTRTTS